MKRKRCFGYDQPTAPTGDVFGEESSFCTVFLSASSSSKSDDDYFTKLSDLSTMEKQHTAISGTLHNFTLLVL